MIDFLRGNAEHLNFVDQVQHFIFIVLEIVGYVRFLRLVHALPVAPGIGSGCRRSKSMSTWWHLE